MTFELVGNAAAYFDCEDKEVLNAGPARSGKTNSELVKARYLCERYPGARGLFARETRKSLTETVLPDWENKVLGRGHPAIGRRKRSNRDSYEFRNGSVIVLHGLDDPENILSGEFDFFTIFQAEQLRRSDPYDALISRLSGTAMPFRQATLDVNPAGERHWILKRSRERICLRCGALADDASCGKCGSELIGAMRHFRFTHHDNPLLFDRAAMAWSPFGVEYLAGTLGRLRGTRRKRLLEGLWVSEEGQVLEEWDPDIHRIFGKLERHGATWMLTVTSPGWQVGAKDPMREARVPLDWFGAGADWGFWPDPGAFQVWGYDRFGRRFMVAEVYRTKQQAQWWADAAYALYQEFPFRYIAVDPSAPALRDAFNIRLGRGGGPMLAMKADNTIRRQTPDLAGIDLMRWGLRDPEGVVRTFLLRDSLRFGMDEALRDAGRPTRTEEEVQEWVFAKQKSTDEPLPKPDDDCDEHGLDAWRYEAGEGWGVRHAADVEKRTSYPDGTAGAIHRHDEKMARARARREAGEA